MKKKMTKIIKKNNKKKNIQFKNVERSTSTNKYKIWKYDL